MLNVQAALPPASGTPDTVYGESIEYVQNGGWDNDKADVITGDWDQGVVGMRVGGQRRLIIPPDLAYGSSGSGSIPPNATILFDITLTGVQ